MSVSKASFVVVAALLIAAPAARAQAAGDVPEKATAQCTDGSWSEAAAQKGACSGHKGVKKWIGKKPKGATARCKDGEYWTAAAAQGACSGHGGVLTKYEAAKPKGK